MKKQKTQVSDVLFFGVDAIVMAVVVISTIYPFIYMVMRSFSSGSTFGKILLWPSEPTTIAYRMMIEKVNFFDGAVISILRSTICPVCTILCIYMAGFSLAKEDLIGRKFLSRFITFSMYFSAGLLPAYMNMVSLHMTGTFYVYLIPCLVNAFNMILIKTYIQDLPRSLEESAEIDGANDAQVAFLVVFPLCLPVLAAVMLFEFVGQWNAYTDTLLYNSNVPELYSLQYMLSNLLNATLRVSPSDIQSQVERQRFNSDALKMAMTVVVCLPVLIVYPFLQKYFVKGILIGSIKG